MEKETVTIPKKEYEYLKECSQMLGQIGSYVAEFCDEETTTLNGVLKLLYEFRMLQAEELYRKLNEK